MIPDENTTYHFIVSLFLEQLYEVLLEKAQKEPMQKLPIRMNFLIDEFANIPKIQNMASMITAARSRNIRFHLIVQGMKQLQQKYEEGAETITGNCNNWIFLYSKEFELLQEISCLCGEVIYDNNVRMPLFSEFDLQHLNKAEGEALVLAGRNYPCLSNLADIDEYPYPKKKAEIMEKGQIWEKIPDFSWEKENKKMYYCEAPLEDDEEFLSLLERRAEDKERGYDWLVAVGPDGMIMAEGTYRRHLIENGSAIGALTCSVLGDEKLEPELLEWYRAPFTLKTRYRFLQKHFPEKVYVTLSEWAEGKFTKIAGRKSDINRIFNTRENKAELIFTDDVNGEPNRKVPLGQIMAYCGNVGRKYLINIAFARANAELKGTEFEKVSWKLLAIKKNKEGEVTYRYIKKGASGELAILIVTDYRFMIPDGMRKPERNV